MAQAKKEFGQHWLIDDSSVTAVIQTANLPKDSTVLEVGPGRGVLTAKLIQVSNRVIAVEMDPDLIPNLKKIFGKEVEIINGDVLSFNPDEIDGDYHVVANIPYYITSKILRHFLESKHKPRSITLLVQKEVAERICAAPGQLSLLALSVQVYGSAKLGDIVPAEHFDPPPKVDSQIVNIELFDQPVVDEDIDKFFLLLKAGFSEKRKKLRSSLSGGLHLDKAQIDDLLQQAQIGENARAQELTLEQWQKLYKLTNT